MTWDQSTGFPFNFGFNADCGSAFFTGAVTHVYVAAAGVPEPAAWVILTSGFGAIGAGLRKRRKLTVAFA